MNATSPENTPISFILKGGKSVKDSLTSDLGTIFNQQSTGFNFSFQLQIFFQFFSRHLAEVFTTAFVSSRTGREA